MTISSIPTIIGRIKVAEPESMLAVFDGGNGKLDAVFAATVSTQLRIARKDRTLIGVYDKTSDIKRARSAFKTITGER